MRENSAPRIVCRVGRPHGRGGFTLLEVVVVLLLLGVLSVYAVNRMGNDMQAVVEAEALKAALRYAQSRAMADVYTWGIAFTGTGYTLVEDNPNVGHPSLPGQGSATRTMPQGVSLATANVTGATILFDCRGQPVTAHITTIGGTSTPTAAYQRITVTKKQSIVVTVTPYTGFVP